MATSYTTLLGLALPATGELSGTWGDTVNNYISTYVDSAVAGALAISLTGDVTLSKTTGSSLGSTSSQYAVLNVTPSASTWTITVPAASKVYVINNLSGSFTFTFKATGQTGVTIAASEKCIVAFNGTDFIKAASTSAFTSPPAGSNTYVQYNNSGAFGASANLTFSGSQLLTTGTNKVIAAATQDAVVVQGRAGGTGSFAVTITPTTLSANRTFTLPDADGTVVLSGGALGTPSSGTVTNLTGTASININGTVGATTATTGTFTSVQITSLGVGTAASGTSGEIRATNAVTAYYSDDRLKTRLGSVENALDKVATLDAFYYEANEVAQSLGYEPIREVGISAQQVQAVMPEVVAPAPIDDKYLTVRYERLVPLLIGAIKELKAEIDMLKGVK
jgi:hypothetical protein